jgi:O-antigen/teichoic acid export membrane protein
LLGLVDQGVVSLVSLLTWVVVGRVAGKESLGLYALGFTVMAFAIAILYALTSLPFTIFSNRLRGKALAEYSGSVVVHQGVLSAVVVVAFAVVALFWPLLVNLGGEGLAELQSVLWVLALTGPFVLLREFSRRVTLSQGRVPATVQIDLAVSILQVAGLLGLAWARALSAATAHAAVGLACALVALGWLFRAWNDFSFRRERWLPDWQRNWELGGWEAASQIIGLAQYYLLLWLLAIWSDAGSAGVFAACIQLAMLPNPFLIGLTIILTPRAARAVARGDRAELARVVGRSTLALSLGMLAFTAGLSLFGDQLLAVLYGAAYSGHKWVVVLLALGRFATGVGLIVDQGLFALERSRVSFTAACWALLVTGGAGVGLMTGDRLQGAAAGILLGSLAGAVWRGCTFVRLLMEGRMGDQPDPNRI